MLTLPPSLAEFLADDPALAPVFLLELAWPDGVRLMTERRLVLDGQTLDPRAWRVEQWEARAFDDATPRLGGFRATVRLIDLPADEEESFGHLSAEFPSVGAPGRLLVAFASPLKPLALPEFAPEDLAVLSAVEVVAWRREDQGAVLELADPLTARGGRLAAPPFDPSAAAAFPFPRIAERRFALLFGAVDGVPLERWRFGPIGRLAADVIPAATLLALDSVAAFPDAGTVQIGDELIEYPVAARTAQTLGTPSQPVTRATPRFHRAGEPVYLRPPGGWAWAVAAHACEAVANVRHASAALPPASFAIEEELADARTLTLVTAPRLPTVEAGTGGPRTLRVDASIGAAWSVGDFNNAQNPAGALAYDDQEAFATVTRVHNRLDLECASLAFAVEGFGPVLSARLVVELAASRAWDETSVVLVGAANDATTEYRAVPRPVPASRGIEGDTTETLQAPIPLRRYTFDFTAYFGAAWELMAATHRLFVILLGGPAETTVLEVTALFWEIGADRPPRHVPVTQLAADVRGWMRAGATEAEERPSRLLHSLMTDARALGLAAGLVDDANLDALAAAEAAAGMRVARVVDGIDTWGGLIAELAQQAGLVVRATGSRFASERPAAPPHFLAPAATLSRERRLTTGVAHRAAEPAVEGRWRVFHGRHADGPGFAAVAEARLGPTGGKDAMTARALWLPADQGAAAAGLAGRLLDRATLPADRVTIDVAWPALAVAWAGDAVELALGEGAPPQTGFVTAARGDADRARWSLEYEPLAPGVRCWSEGPHAILQHAGRALHVLVGGRVVAILRHDGALLVRGCIREEAALPDVDAPATWLEGEQLLVLASESGGAFSPRVAFAASGDLLVWGTLRADVGDLGTRAECLASGDGEVALSLATGRTLLVAPATKARVDLLGSPRESCLVL